MNATDLGFLGPARQARAAATRESRLAPGESPAPAADFAAELTGGAGEAAKPAVRGPAPSGAEPAPAAETPSADEGLAREPEPPAEAQAPASAPAAPDGPPEEAAPEERAADPAPPAVSPPAPPLAPATAAGGAGEGMAGKGMEAPAGLSGAAASPPAAGEGAALENTAGKDAAATLRGPGGPAKGEAAAAPEETAPARAARDARPDPEPAREAPAKAAPAREPASGAFSSAAAPSQADPAAAAPFALPAAAPEAPWRLAAATPAQAAQTADPRAVVAQITVAASEAAGEGARIEIRLDPVELGKLHISLTETEHGLTATVRVERPETMTLLRRHSDMLERELSAAGYGAVSLDLASAGGDREPGAGSRGRSAAFHSGAYSGAGPGGAPEAASYLPAAVSGVRAPRAEDGPLDIRL